MTIHNDYIGKPVLVRTYSAGVHIGTLKSKDGQSVVLTDARRIWRWRGALELYAVAQRGLNAKKSTLSVAAPEIMLEQAIEIHLTSEAARKTFEASEECHERSV